MNAQFQYSTGVVNARQAPPTAPVELHEDIPDYDYEVIKQKKKDIKKACRILKELSNDALKLFPLLPIPSAWLTRCLLSTHYCSSPQSNWHEAIMLTLVHIKQSSAHTNSNTGCFFELDGKTPLFPNSENFSLPSTHLYASTMVRYLRTRNLLSRQA